MFGSFFANLNYRMRLIIPKYLYAQATYYTRKKKFLNLKEPKTFADKLWWLKYHYFNPLMTPCSDKWEVRKYVEKCGLKDILVDCYGHYDSVDDINLDDIPTEDFFLKVNNTSGGNLICHKSTFDKEAIRPRFEKLLKDNFYWHGREYNYKYIKPCIIAEKLLKTDDPIGLIDYKFFCFSGEPKLLFIDTGVCNEDGTHAEHSTWFMYDLDFKPLDMYLNKKHAPMDLKKPENYETMTEYARMLAAPFPHCRIDFYNIDGKIYFGEITFFHCSGYTVIEPHEEDLKVGSWIPMDKSYPQKYNLSDVEASIRSLS